MEMQNFILEHYEILLLIAGILLLFLGVTPIVSNKYYYRYIHNKPNILFSEKEGYIYNRYLRQLTPIIMGASLLAFALRQLLLQ